MERRHSVNKVDHELIDLYLKGMCVYMYICVYKKEIIVGCKPYLDEIKHPGSLS